MNTPDTLRVLVSRIGISQRHAARLIGISERQMRSYLADPESAATAIDAPAYVRLALEGIAARLDAIDLPDALMDTYVSARPGDRLAIWPHGRWQILDPGAVLAHDSAPAAIVTCDPSDGWTAETRDRLRSEIEESILTSL